MTMPKRLPTTEKRNPRSENIDERSTLEIVTLINEEDMLVPEAVARERQRIAEAVDVIVERFERGGRLFYVGAGTSGRLGVLDAAECLPTFGIAPDRVIGIMAGGEAALRRSMEGAEDDRAQAARDLAALEPPLNENDLVVGITASGTTPYVLAALEHADAAGAHTVLVTCNPECDGGASQVIALRTGPEVLAGSTRLKAGTATKMVLNMISTGAMALSGHMYEGWMVGLKPVCAKLERRALHIIQALTGKDREEAAGLLKSAKGRIPVAVLMAQKDLDPRAAAALLARARGSLRSALEED